MKEMKLPVEMQRLYLQRRLNEVELLRSEARVANVDQFQRIGHQLSGNAVNYGFPELGKIGLELEALTAADLQSKGLALIQKYHSQILVYIDSLEA